MRAFVRSASFVLLALSASTAMGQSNLSPVDNGFFRPAADPALTPPRPREEPTFFMQSAALQIPAETPGPGASLSAAAQVATQPAAAPLVADVTQDVEQRRQEQLRREQQQMIELERQNELNRQNTPRRVPLATR